MSRPTQYQDWIFEELARVEPLDKELKDRIDLLDARSTFWNDGERG